MCRAGTHPDPSIGGDEDKGRPGRVLLADLHVLASGYPDRSPAGYLMSCAARTAVISSVSLVVGVRFN